MKFEISYKRILLAVCHTFSCVVLVLLGTLGWTLDIGVLIIDWLFPLAILFACLCVFIRGPFSKTTFIVLLLTYVLYLFILKQSITLR